MRKRSTSHILPIWRKVPTGPERSEPLSGFPSSVRRMHVLSITVAHRDGRLRPEWQDSGVAYSFLVVPEVAETQDDSPVCTSREKL
ncbi:Eukaryotic translation initiation factor 3 subunit K [Manis javanica]|nr:Eukaryotic translation initiation factor 3 subunit K [Manis javanica]